MSIGSLQSLKATVVRAVNGPPQSPAVLLGVLLLTGIGALGIVAGQDTRAARMQLTEAGTRVYPVGVFRGPGPAIVAPGGRASQD